MERIHTRVVIKIDTGEVLEDRFYLYNGPMAWCGEDPGDASEYGGAFESGGFVNSNWDANFGPNSRGGQQVSNDVGNLLGSFTDPLTGGLFNEPSPMGSFADLAGNPIDPSYRDSIAASFNSPSWGDINTNFNTAVKPATNWGWTAKGLSLGLITAGIPGALVGSIIGHLAGNWQNMAPRDAVNNALYSAGIYDKTDAVMSSLASNPTGGQGGVDRVGGVPGGSNQDVGGGTGGNMATGTPTDLAGMALDLYNRTAPARQSIIDRGTNFLEGGLDVTQSPMWGSGKNAAETQYQNARDAMMANLPGGGALQSSLATGETDKARTLTDLASRIGMDEYSKIYGLASGAPQQSMAGMGVAGQTNATLAGQEMYQNIQEDAQKNQLYGDLGAGIGEGWGDKE